jgi:hypothetical protein
MTFNPKFPSFRSRIVLLAIVFAVYGAAVLVSGRDPCHGGRHAIAVAVILSSLAVLPESPAKPKPENYGFTEGNKT